MRKLFIIPIVHTAADLGRLEHRLDAVKQAMMPSAQIEASRKLVLQFWSELRAAIQSWQLDFSSTKIYQDALPVAPADIEGLEIKIIRELAAVGSSNHQLLEWLSENGATIIGTESPELLVAEYNLVKKALEENEQSDETAEQSETDGSSPQSAGSHSDPSLKDRQEELADLLNRRDQFIADRIDKTLANGQTGIIFLGMLHTLEKWLPEDIEVDFPIGQPSDSNRSRIVHTASN